MPKKMRTVILESKPLRTLLWVLTGAVVILAAVQYLRVTQLIPLGGDDRINIPSTWYTLTHTPTLQYIWEQYEGIFTAFPFGYGRFFPLGGMPRYLRYLTYGSVGNYRLYLIGFALFTAAVLALLFARITGSKAFGMCFLALTPMMFCLWNDPEENGLFSYGTTALFPVLVFGLYIHLMLNWARTRRWYWALLCGVCAFWCCASYETGYIYLFAAGFLALAMHERFWDGVCTGLPALGGEAAAFAMYIANWLHQGSHYAGTVAATADKGKLLLTWVQQMSGGFPLNQPLLALATQPHLPRNYIVIPLSAGDIIWPLLLALVVGACLWFGKIALDRRQIVCLFFAGSCMLAGPAFLIALSGKYQGGVHGSTGTKPISPLQANPTASV